MQSNKEREAFSRRLKAALGKIGDDGSSPTRLAREFNRRYPGTPVTMHATRKWLNGEALPAQDKLKVLAAWLKVTAEWLRFDEGNDGRATDRTWEQAVDFELAREIGALSPEHRAAVRALLKALRRGEKSAGNRKTVRKKG